jgi:hypothetical protein
MAHASAIYRPNPQSGGAWLSWHDPSDLRAMKFRGQAVIDWTPTRVSMVLGAQPEGDFLKEVAMPWFPQPVANRRARDVLEPLFDGCGQWLPLSSDREPLWIFNVTNVLPEALNEEASDIDRIPNGKIFFLRRHEFRPEVVDGQNIFKIPQMAIAPFYLSEKVRAAIDAAGLSGWDLLRLWDRVDGGIEESLF